MTESADFTTDDEWDHPTMTREQFMERLAELSAEASVAEADMLLNGQEIPWWWLSFIDPERPEGTRFLGVCIVQGATGMAAVSRSHDLGVNPGGQVMMVPVDDEFVDPLFREQWCDRLLGKSEAELLAESM